MTKLYRHYIVDFEGCDETLLSNPDRIEQIARRACKAAGATIVGDCVARFVPHGVTVVLVLAGSHLVVSTWPEHCLIMCDFLLCADGLVSERLLAELEAVFSGTAPAKIRYVERHIPSDVQLDSCI
jgi:S-adenosylmethionine decarboxylase